jgi:hypothetical protein
MGYTNELFESRFVDIYWNSKPSMLDFGFHWWGQCGCFWICLGWIKINVLYKDHGDKG